MKLTPEQQKEFDAFFTYPRRYFRWLRAVKATIPDYNGTVKHALELLYPDRTLLDISLLLGFTLMSVGNMMRRLGLPLRPSIAEVAYPEKHPPFRGSNR